MYKVLHIPTGTFIHTNFYGSVGLYSLEEANKYKNSHIFLLLLVSSQSEFENKFQIALERGLCPSYFEKQDNEISHYELIDANE